jgi:hypothetical protein
MSQISYMSHFFYLAFKYKSGWLVCLQLTHAADTVSNTSTECLETKL